MDRLKTSSSGNVIIRMEKIWKSADIFRTDNILINSNIHYPTKPLDDIRVFVDG